MRTNINKDYKKEYIARYDKDFNSLIINTAKSNIVICIAKEIDEKLTELHNRGCNFDFIVDTRIEVKYKTKDTEIVETEQYGIEYNEYKGLTYSISLTDIAKDIIDDYLERYTDIDNYCEVEEIKITYKKIEIEN